MTARVLEYAIRLANQAVGSGQVERNHSWKTVGAYLLSALFADNSHWQDLISEGLDLLLRSLFPGAVEDGLHLVCLEH